MSVQYKWAKYRFVVQVLLLFKVELFPVNQQLLKLNLKDVFQILYMPNIRQMPNASNWYFIPKWITLVILNLYSTFKAIHGELSMIKLSYAPYTSTWPRSHCIEAMRKFFAAYSNCKHTQWAPLCLTLIQPCCSTTAQLGCYVAWLGKFYM